MNQYTVNHKTGKWYFLVTAGTPDDAIAQVGIRTPKDQWVVKLLPPATLTDILVDIGTPDECARAKEDERWQDAKSDFAGGCKL